jgi:hypothetical protein
MPVRPPAAAVLALGLLAGGPALALTCTSGIYGGTVEFRCSQPEATTSSCRWSAELEAEDGSKGVRSGTFLLPPRAKDLVVVSENRLGGRRIVRGQVKLEGCSIGLVGPAASDAAAEFARGRPALQSVARPASAAAPAASAPASAARRAR